jgi:hypothetical protein
LQGGKDDLDTYLQELRSQIETLKAENEALRNAPPAAQFKPPEPGDLLNQLKAKRKNATASFADIEAILEILEGWGDTSREPG